MTWTVTDQTGAAYAAAWQDGLLTLPKERVAAGVEYLEFRSPEWEAETGEDGYFVIADAGGKGSRLCRFTEREDGERLWRQDLLPLFGVKRKTGATLVIAEGLRHEMMLRVRVEDGHYSLSARYLLSGDAPYEDITLRVLSLGAEGDYSAMARAYRAYRLAKGDCRPLALRMRESEALRYAIKAPEIRIRMGWKPAPPAILEQTLENEPPMKVACTFRRVRDLVDELQRQGVDRAEICLVGWNKSGHDGRYPDLFPVEESLGGEAELKDLIAYAKERGYQIVCHTNSTDGYSIASSFSPEIVAKERDGSLSVNPYAWSGGRMYNLCPQSSLELAKKDLPLVRELGFSGLHYIDVITVVPPRNCHDPAHPVNRKEAVEYYLAIMRLAKAQFGGFASEGVFDFASAELDYGLYRSWPAVFDAMTDEEIPLWELVYHGIILSNPNTDTVNYPVKPKKNGLFVLECGGRPSFYFYSKFLEGSGMDDWLGSEDLLCDTDEQLVYSVGKIKEAYDLYLSLLPLQTQFMEKHEEIEKGVKEITYEDGTRLRVDYNTETYTVLPPR